MKCKSDFLIWYFILIPFTSIWFSKICCSCKIVFHKLHCISSKLLEETNCGILLYNVIHVLFIKFIEIALKLGFFRFSRRKTNMLNSFFRNHKSISFAFFSLGYRLKRRNSLLNWSRKTAKELQGRWDTYWDSLHTPYKYPLADGFDRV